MDNIQLDPRLLDTYPEIRLGCLRFSAVVKEPSALFWQDFEENVAPRIRRTIEGREWSEIPGIRGSRAAYKAFGRNPGRYRVSSEALLRRLRRGDALYRINSVVDVNNLISVESGLSVGSYDLDRINGPIVFRKAEAGEGYNGIGKEFLNMENLLVLADNSGIFGSSMSDSTRAMVTEQTTHVLAVIYCFEKGIDLYALLEKAAGYFARYADAQSIEMWIDGVNL